MVNSGVDGYTKILNQRKILKHKNSGLKTKRTLKLKYKLSGTRLLHLVCQGGDSPICPHQFATNVNYG